MKPASQMKRADVSAYAAKARQRLGDPGVRLSVILGLMFVLFSFSFGFLIGDLASTLFFPEKWLITAEVYYMMQYTVCFVLGFFFAVPACAGLIRMCGSIAAGEDPDLRELFFPYASPVRFLRCCAVVLFPVFKYGVFLIPVFAREFIPAQYQGKIPSPFGSLITLAGLAVGLLWLRLMRTNGMFAHFVIHRDMRLGEAFRSAKKAGGERGFALKLFFSMTPWHLLALATVFVTALFDTVPVLLTARALRAGEYCDRIDKKFIDSQT